MTRNRDRSLDATGQPKLYKPADPQLREFDHSVGTLSVDGEVVGHLASVVGEMRFPTRQPWPWFVVVWLDGSKENSFEDYGPSWYTVRELDAGRFEFHGRSIAANHRLFGIRLRSSKPGPPMTFEFMRLPSDVAARRWDELGLVDADF
ncbi:MAG: hypothetical protein ABI566_06100 [Pseudolysinimonas sp.]